MLEQLHYWLAGITERRILVIAAIILFLPMLKPGCSSSLEDQTFRVATNLSGNATESGIAVLAVDQRTFNTYGPWPGPANAISEALAKVKGMDPELIVVDDRSDRGRFDLLYALPRLKGDAKSIVGYSFHETLSDLPTNYAETTGGKPPKSAEQIALPSTPSDDYSLKSMAGIDLKALTGSGKRDTEDGFSNSFPDVDGTVRSQQLAVRLGHRAYPSLALSAAAKTHGFTPLVIEKPSGKPEAIALGERRMEVPSDTGFGIPFKGPAGSFPTISVVDVVAGNVKPEGIKGKTVMVGFTDPDIALMLKTPFGRMPSVEVLANTIAGLGSMEKVTYLVGVKWSAVTMLIALALYALLIVRFGLRNRLIGTIFALVVAWLASILLFRFTGVLLPAMQFAIFSVALLLVSIFWRVFIIEIPRRVRMRTFLMRVDPSQLDQAMRKPGLLVARGISRDIVALAVDIRGYAAITGRSAQEALCLLMREYRTTLARILIKHGAFIDSWAGDECRAAFGAIMPGGNDEMNACMAAYDAVRTFAKVREDVLKRYGVERIRLGIGIAAGKSAVGGLGPRGVTDIGITGEAMERAVTLRAFNKSYRTSIIVDDRVREIAENSFAFRPLDPILAAGQDKLIHLHELIGKTGIILPHLDKYLEAREAYLKGEFERAVHLFSIILAEHPHDGPSLVLLKRSRTLSKTPPKEWKGVWRG